MSQTNSERRAHQRHDLACPARLVDQTGTFVATGKTRNISDGGMLLPVKSQDAASPGTRVDVKLSIPRSTPNTYLMQPFRGQALVVRKHDEPGGPTCLAVQFEPPLDLDLEV